MAGRSVGNPLSDIGERQAKAISRALAGENFSAIYFSPLERCLQTVTPLAVELGKRPRKMPEFLEMDYGDWTARKLSELRREGLWRKIQKRPEEVTFPGGESFLAANRRVVRGLNQLSKRHGSGKVLVVSHGDIIKIALSNVLGSGLAGFQRIIVDPASLSIIDWPGKIMLRSNVALMKPMKEKSAKSRRDLGGGSNV